MLGPPATQIFNAENSKLLSKYVSPPPSHAFTLVLTMAPYRYVECQVQLYAEKNHLGMGAQCAHTCLPACLPVFLSVTLNYLRHEAHLEEGGSWGTER